MHTQKRTQGTTGYVNTNESSGRCLGKHILMWVNNLSNYDLAGSHCLPLPGDNTLCNAASNSDTTQLLRVAEARSKRAAYRQAPPPNVPFLLPHWRLKCSLRLASPNGGRWIPLETVGSVLVLSVKGERPSVCWSVCLHLCLRESSYRVFQEN